MFSQKQNKKYHSKTQLDEKKTYLFMMFFITSFFSISPLHVRWLLPYIIKNNSSEGLLSSTTNQSPCLDQCNGKIKLITHLCCPFRTNYRSSHQRYSIKKVFLEISQNLQEKACTRVIIRDSGTSDFL